MLICPKCGASVEAGADSCEKCGKIFKGASIVKNSRQGKERKKILAELRNSIAVTGFWFFIIVAGGLAGIAVIIYFISRMFT